MTADSGKYPADKPKSLGHRVQCALLGGEREERHISLTAIAVLLVVALSTGAVILWQAINNTQQYLEQEVGQTVRDRASIVQQALTHASEAGASVATDRPHLRTVLGRIAAGTSTATDDVDLSRILDNIVKRKNIRAIELRDIHGRVLGKRGEFLVNPKLSAPIHLPYPAMLLWDQTFLLDLRVPILEKGLKLGEGKIQLTLADIDNLFSHHKELGKTGEFTMCGNLSARDMTCFPSRWSPEGNRQTPRAHDGKPLPMHYALEGKTGTTITTSDHNQQVVAAYGVVGDSNLGVVMKRDRAEFLDLSRRSFTSSIPLLLLLSAGGLWLLRWRLAPLVRKVVESRTQLKALIDSAPDAIVSLDARGRIHSFNPAAVDLFGYQPDEVADQHISLLVAKQDGDGGATATLPEPGPVHGKRKDGGVFPMELSIAQASSETGAAYVATLRDITERKQAEEALKKHYDEVQALNSQLKETQHQLLQSEKMASVGQLAAGVAHEINNPIGYVYSNLGALDTYSQTLLQLVTSYEAAEAAITDNAVLEQLQTAKEKADIQYLRTDMSALMNETREGIGRVKKIVQNLKDFSRIDTTDEWHWADLHSGLDSTLNIIWSELKYKVEVRKEYADIPEVECRPSQLNQVFMNLLVNAGHAIAEKGVITIRTGQEGDQVWVEIEDSGKGIAEKHLTRIFDPFFTTKPIGQGTGLGLSLSYSIVENHGGHIEVHSKEGQGTTFKIWLPIQQSKSIDPAAV